MSTSYLQTVNALRALGEAIRDQFGADGYWVLPRSTRLALEQLRAAEQAQIRSRVMRVNAGNRRRQGRVKR
jgi:hypothetical protein